MSTMHSTARSVFCAVVIAFTVSSCQVGRFVAYNFADIHDYKKFPSRSLFANTSAFRFYTTATGKAPKMLSDSLKGDIPFDQYLEQQKTVAFLIIKNDTIQYERYFKKYNRESIVPSFSMAKSVLSILIGCAVDEGLIHSIDDPITLYVPDLKKNGFDRVTIKHLLQMTSGIKFEENYFNPFSSAASFYYGRNLRKALGQIALKTEPGQKFEYVSGNTQLLGLVLERALKDKTITGYLQEKLWTPLGMEYGGSWSIDRQKTGMEKAFCCINARPVDFAKIGRLYKENGNWNGQQIVSKAWVEASTKVDTTAGSVPYYQYQWWLPSPDGDFMAQGILGQFVYVHPEKNLIIVRMGKKSGKANWRAIFTALAAAY